ncbi:MAG: bifunctional glutamate N-acetyltransferase/amino-acid acetyltransferase ArgJ [Helicobacteraceae bacterium]
MNIYSVEGGVCAVSGFFAGGTSAGLKGGGRLDLAYIKSSEPCVWGGVFTSNKFKAAPLIDALSKQDQLIDGVIINSKNANAMTLEAGLQDVREILAGLDGTWLMSSTGVIGRRLPKDKIKSALAKLSFDETNSAAAQEAIMTTDSFQKHIALRVQTNSGEFTIGAMAKGAGMIAPSLATMLCFVTTDADLSAAQIRECIKGALDGSFNAISVDGDTSTNDSVIVLSSRRSGVADASAFGEALKMAFHKLALDIARDGEGAKKLVAFEVKNAESYEQAKTCAKALANSLLVKTALFGEDPNWGRIASTIGASGVTCDERALKIHIGSVKIYDGGEIEGVEENAGAVLKANEFRITCDLGVGAAGFTAYGCDLGYEYVKINASYRT